MLRDEEDVTGSLGNWGLALSGGGGGGTPFVEFELDFSVLLLLEFESFRLSCWEMKRDDVPVETMTRTRETDQSLFQAFHDGRRDDCRRRVVSVRHEQ